MKKLLIVALFLSAYRPSSAQEFPAADPQNIALRPIHNEFRELMDLSGIWKFKADPSNEGLSQGWYRGLTEYSEIAVPGSWNEQFTDMRDYMDWVWYETEAFLPLDWKGKPVYLRINDATYAAKVWINGQAVGYHEGAHVPFAFDISEKVRWNATNRITIQVENQLSPARLPTGKVPGGSFSSFPEANYDFFPYAGLNRSVVLFTVPKKSHIKDITLLPDLKGEEGLLTVRVAQEGTVSTGEVVLSGDGKEIFAPLTFKNGLAEVTVTIPEVRKWAPADPFLYSVSVALGDHRKPLDLYELQTGIRTVSVNTRQILLNGEPLFLKGFGKHEDFPVLGRGTAYPVMVKDFELMKWTGANSFRTTHYPYEEAYYDMADRQGFLIIGETPAVGMFFEGDSAELAQRQAANQQYIEEMILRDKNHPSVIMWCVANEPNDKAQIGFNAGGSFDQNAYDAFAEHFETVRRLDKSRLVTYVGVMGGPSQWFALPDVICINRYWGWYTSPGNIPEGAAMLSRELDGIHEKFNKPIIVTEFGADAYPGMHAQQVEMFTEEYQMEFIKAYLDVADSKDYVTGMHVWNFADFKTSQGIIRFGGYNYKGVFTRDRRPKMAAHYLRSRWNEGD